jgi:Ca-activated chloride channel family protein
MKFGNPEAFRLLIIVVPLLAYLGYRTLKVWRNLGLFFDKATAPKMITPLSGRTTAVKFGLTAAGVLLIIIAIARPWGKPIKSEVNVSGIDIMVAVDVSSSMAATDIRPSRMEAVKAALKDFSSSLNGDRVGMITFAGVDFVQCPLTLDYDAYDLIIDSLSPGMLAKDGTAIGNAIKSCVQRMVEKAGKSRVMVLITDGENNTGMSPIEAANLAKQNDIRIYTIGAGTAQGGVIPEGQDMFGRTVNKIYKGEEVVTKLDDSELKEIAGITGGKYYLITAPDIFASIKDDIRNMQENSTKKDQMSHEENYAPWLLWGVVFFVLGQVLPGRKTAWAASMANLMKKK